MNKNLLQINIERDLTEILRLIEDYMNRTYIKEIEQEMHKCKAFCEENPCKEVQLLTALRPFMPMERQNTFQELSELLKYEQVAQELIPVLMHTGTREKPSDQERIKQFVIKLLIYKLMFRGEEKHR
ncbi:MAG: hypothetical protein RR324_04520 [Cellulosilyticaceae bacterium]